jgi:hypothetical protein
MLLVFRFGRMLAASGTLFPRRLCCLTSFARLSPAYRKSIPATSPAPPAHPVRSLYTPYALPARTQRLFTCRAISGTAMPTLRKRMGHRSERYRSRLHARETRNRTNDSRALVGQDVIEVDSHVRKSLCANAVIGKDIGAQLFVGRDCGNRIRNRVWK